jgi:uncharacterized membrane protein YdjX (TVP38/TMEM64 family)
VSLRARLLLLAAAVVLAAVAVYLAGPQPADLRDLTQDAGPVAALALLGAWLVLVPALFSGPALAATSGLVLGTGLGAGVAIVGATLGACVSFVLARRVAGDAARRLAGTRIGAVERRLVQRPVLGIAALRVAPGMPAGILAYAAGLTRVRLRHFMAGMAIGGAPRIVAYALLGGSLADFGSSASWIGLSVLATMTVGGAVVAWRSRRALLPV